MVSDGFCRLSEYPREALIGRNCRFLQGPATDPEATRQLRGISELNPHFKAYKEIRGNLSWSRTLLDAAQLYENGKGILEL